LIGFLWWETKEYEKISEKRILTVCNFLNPWINLYLKYEKKYDKLGLKYNLWTVGNSKEFKKLLKKDNVNSLICNGKY
jgi:glycerophosphoryl diester phosphodiesterase